jgi:hypothetical protein
VFGHSPIADQDLIAHLIRSACVCCRSNISAAKRLFPIESTRFNPVRWPSGLRRQLKVIPIMVHQQYAGPKGRGFKSHSHQHVLLSFRWSMSDWEVVVGAESFFSFLETGRWGKLGRGMLMGSVREGLRMIMFLG